MSDYFHGLCCRLGLAGFWFFIALGMLVLVFDVYRQVFQPHTADAVIAWLIGLGVSVAAVAWYAAMRSIAWLVRGQS